MAKQLYLPRALDSNGSPAAGAKAFVYQTNTETPVTVYTDQPLSTAHDNPIVADAEGRFAQAFYGGTTDLKVVFTTSTGASIETLDPSPLFAGVASGAGDIPFDPTAQNPAEDVQTAIENISGSTSLATLQANASQAVLTTGTNTSYIVTAKETITEYAEKQEFLVTFHTACGDNPKINIDGVGSVFLRRLQQNGTLVNLDNGDIQSNQTLLIRRNGAFFVVHYGLTATANEPGPVKIVTDTTLGGGSNAWPPTELATRTAIDSRHFQAGGTIASGVIAAGDGTPTWTWQKGFNATITDTQIGGYTVAFNTAEDDAEYAVFLSVDDGADTRRIFAQALNKTVNGFDVVVVQVNTSARVDPDELSILVIR